MRALENLRAFHNTTRRARGMAVSKKSSKRASKFRDFTSLPSSLWSVYRKIHKDRPMAIRSGPIQTPYIHTTQLPFSVDHERSQKIFGSTIRRARRIAGGLKAGRLSENNVGNKPGSLEDSLSGAADTVVLLGAHIPPTSKGNEETFTPIRSNSISLSDLTVSMDSSSNTGNFEVFRVNRCIF